jgi:hypothetical protein
MMRVGVARQWPAMLFALGAWALLRLLAGRLAPLRRAPAAREGTHSRQKWKMVAPAPSRGTGHCWRPLGTGGLDSVCTVQCTVWCLVFDCSPRARPQKAAQ